MIRRAGLCYSLDVQAGPWPNGSRDRVEPALGPM